MHSIRLQGGAASESWGRNGPEEQFYERTMMVRDTFRRAVFYELLLLGARHSTQKVFLVVCLRCS